MARTICTACQKPVSFDETRLPLHPVTFPCPSCKAPITVDRRALNPTEVVKMPRVSPVPPAPAAIEPPPSPSDEGADLLGPKALIVGADNPALHQAARDIGLLPVYAPTAEAGRDFFLEKQPPVVFLHPAQLTRPPLAEIQPLTGLAAADRRRGFFILVSDSLKTLDGTVAFLYDVNLVVATKDLPGFRRIYREAEEEHQKFYGAFRVAESALHEGD
ncbi:MAG TPA: hypothetical protein DD490_31475 [Acidobacteria bacterium]|nr:hypothetical protein [Acidobacteriota bacterium]